MKKFFIRISFIFLSTQLIYANSVKEVVYNNDNKEITVNIAYKQPTKVVFPAFIERIEMIRNARGIIINDIDEIQNGTDSLMITKRENNPDNAVMYITVLGKRIILNLNHNEQNDTMVKINFHNSVFGNNSVSNQRKQPTKKMRSRDLTRQTNIKSVEMITKMIEGTAHDYFKMINLNGKVENHDKSFFGFNTKEEESVADNMFKHIFAGNRSFFTLYEQRQIQPVEMYTDSYTVVKSNKVNDVLDIIGLKSQWCNFSKQNAMQINIDDIKVVFGKNILAAKHPMGKIAPRTCQPVYVVFYLLN